MSKPYPLQAGDVAPDYATYDYSEAGDRREQAFRREGPRPLMPYEKEKCTPDHSGENAAPQHEAPQGELWRCGSPAPNSFLAAPFQHDVINEGHSDEVFDINIRQYGDPLDPMSPIRVVDVTSKWKMDTDEDNHEN